MQQRAFQNLPGQGLSLGKMIGITAVRDAPCPVLLFPLNFQGQHMFERVQPLIRQTRQARHVADEVQK